MSADRVTKEQNERLRKLARALLAEGRTQGAIALAIGMQRTNFSAFLAGRQGLGLINAVRLLRFSGRGPETFFPELAPTKIEIGGTKASPDHRYPNFVLAAEFARRDALPGEGPVVERAIQRVGGLALHADVDPRPGEWLAQINAERVLLARERAQAAQAPRAKPAAKSAEPAKPAAKKKDRTPRR
jgi:hypothetical protein